MPYAYPPVTPPTPAEHRRLFRLYRDSPDEAVRLAARHEIIHRNLPFVELIAFHRPRRMAFEDAMGWGVVGLCRAIEKYDPNLGFTFTTYASFWIKQAIGRAARNDSLVHVPYHFVCDRNKQAAGVKLSAKRAAGVEAGRKALAFEAAGGEDLTTPRLLDHRGRGGVDETDDADEAERLMSCLDDGERLVIRRRIWDGRTLADVGRELGLTRERVRQIELRAIGLMQSAAGVAS